MNREKIFNTLKFLTLIFVFGLTFYYGPTAHALDCTEIGDEPKPSQMICPIVRILNVLMYFGGIVLAVIIGYGAIKLSLSLGDPKGFQSARQTWTYALIGFGVVAGALSILAILNTTFGLDLPGPNDLMNAIGTWWDNFVCETLKVVDPDTGCTVTLPAIP